MTARRPRRKAKATAREAPRDIRELFVSAALRILDHPDADVRKLDARTVAAEAGRSLGSLTFQFKGGLWELRAMTAARGLDMLGEVLRQEQVKPKRGPLEVLQAMSRAFLQFAMTHERLYRLILSELWDAQVSDMRGSLRRLVREQVMLCQVTGVIRLGDPERLTRLVAGVSWGITQSVLDGETSRGDAAEAITDAIEDLVTGIAPGKRFA